MAPEKIPAIEDMKSRLCRDAQESVERLRTTIERMQRFTNLDRAEVMRVDLCQLLRDVADVAADAATRRPRFELALAPLPAIEVRPQLMSAVFSAVLQNAAEASPEGTPVRIETQMQDREVKVRVIDRGEGMTARELVEVMEPAFRVKDGRMTACNWNLFGARQIVRQHGGEITVHSEPGRGTTVEVVLPVR
jgi:signal transduction histidine kinase